MESSNTKSKNQNRVGQYILGKTLGSGSTGKVKLGTHFETGQNVAVKIIPKESIKDIDGDSKSANKKLEREIAIMKLMQHPSILQLYDVYESTDDLYLILELVEGGELFDYLVKQGRLRESEALNFFQQIIAGVDYCHKFLICHRDLKPENLLLDLNKNIKIADFGMSSVQVNGTLLETSCGSPHYASPEIIRGLKYHGASADIWSCGIILYALLTGNLPFDDENIRVLLQKVKTGVYSIPDFVPSEAADLIRKMLVVNPSKRITMEEIEKHPWFTRRPYTWKANSSFIPPTEKELDAMFPHHADSIDMDILNSLQILGYGNEEEVIRSLLQPGQNYEKIFYWALCRRKNEFLENYDPENDLAFNDVPTSKPRRRIDSQGSRVSMYTEKALSMEGIPSDEYSKLRSTLEKHKSISPSPLASSVDSAQVNQDDPKNGKESALKALDGESAKEAPKEKKRQSLLVDMRKLNISEKIRPKSIVTNSNKELLKEDEVPGTPKFHRQYGDSHQSTPDEEISNSPKKSWFGNLFNFKPETIDFHSPANMSDAQVRKITEDKLNALRIDYQLSKDKNSLKCKFNANGSLSPVKFKISFQKNSKGGMTISCVQQQGALSTFHVFTESFAQLWTTASS